MAAIRNTQKYKTTLNQIIIAIFEFPKKLY